MNEKKNESQVSLTLNQVIGLALVTAGIATLVVYGLVKVATKK
jgi:hypothetical protein